MTITTTATDWPTANDGMLSGVHPELLQRMRKIYAAMAALGWPMKPTAGVRTTAQQQALYASGRTTPGVIVTNADGMTHKSNHQVHADGYGHAVDSAFRGDDPFLEHDPLAALKWATYGALVRSQQLNWGGDWTGLMDRPHAELPDTPPVTVPV